MVGLDIMEGLMEQHLGYDVRQHYVLSIYNAEQFAALYPADYNYVMAHGVFFNGVYQGTIQINGHEVPASLIDNSPYFNGSYHCGQGPGGAPFPSGISITI